MHAAHVGLIGVGNVDRVLEGELLVAVACTTRLRQNERVHLGFRVVRRVNVVNSVAARASRSVHISQVQGDAMGTALVLSTIGMAVGTYVGFKFARNYLE